MRVALPATALDGYRRFSLYDSPFPAHDRGRAVDLYPEGGRRSVVAPSPVAGVVREVLTVRAPSRPYAADRDHLVLIDVDPAASGLGVAATATTERDGADGNGPETGSGRGPGRERERRRERESASERRRESERAGGHGRRDRRGRRDGRRPDRGDRESGEERGRGELRRDLVARALHVDPWVDPGDRVAVGDPLGETVRSGFFAPWVADHLHLGLRPAERNLRRATGSLPLSVDVGVEPLRWDGTGRVAAAGETYVVLDAPEHPAPGETWVGVAGEAGRPRADARGAARPARSAAGIALDGGVPHYPRGGVHAVGDRVDGPRVVFLAGTPVGRTDGRTVRWRDVAVTANGRPMTGVSLAVGRDEGFGVTLVSRDGHAFAVGDRIAVGIDPGG